MTRCTRGAGCRSQKRDRLHCAKRTYHFKGSPRQVGFALGRALGERLEHNIDRYIKNGPARHGLLDTNKLQNGALPWLRSLPQRFQDEFEGLAKGAKVSLQRLAEWCFVEECVHPGCTGLVCLLQGSAWVARNNDIWAPDLWGYMTIREIDGRIPTISFGLEGEPFTATGINREQLWLHYHYLPLQDAPGPEKPHMACYVWLTEALETCRTIGDVEALLCEVNRDGGMMLFAVDGKTDEIALFECTCTGHFKRQLSGNWIVGTNHYSTARRVHDLEYRTTSQLRFARVEELLYELWERGGIIDTPRELMRILAHPGVEGRGKDYGTVYANVACPSKCVMWYTFGGYPAASAGAWHPVAWPWEKS
jgi:hypothetical protein